MGGEWGVGASLALETLPVRARGVASGILQQGYATGYLIAAAVFGLFFEAIGWRGMFVVGALPALLVLYIRAHVRESPAWRAGQAKPMAERLNLWTSFLRQPILYVYAILLMASFNFLSHGSQDLYPTFLTKQRAFDRIRSRSLRSSSTSGRFAAGRSSAGSHNSSAASGRSWPPASWAAR